MKQTAEHVRRIMVAQASMAPVDQTLLGTRLALGRSSVRAAVTMGIVVMDPIIVSTSMLCECTCL